MTEQIPHMQIRISQCGNFWVLWFASIEGEYIMIAKTVPKHGTGSAASAITYIAGKFDHEGNERDEVIHLFGDGQQVVDLTEAMTCKHTHLSSVLSFTKKESARLSVDDIRKLVAEFAAHHAEPMGVNAIAGCAYLHVEDGRYDVHLIQAQQDLESGKRVDLYLDNCGDTQRIADWQDCKNYELKLDDPRDPSRIRLTNDKVREAKNRKELRAWVNNHLLNKTIKGEINSRAGIITELESLGFEIKRQTGKSISIKSPDLSQNIRLTGGIFHESFTGIEGIREAVKAGQQRSEEDYRQQYDTARSRLAASNQKRAERISKKLKIDLVAREQRAQESRSQNTMADLDHIGCKLHAAHRGWVLVNEEDQRPDPNAYAGAIPDAIISGRNLRHHPESRSASRQERQLLDQNKVAGGYGEFTEHEITNHRPDVSGAERHAATMRRLSASSRGIEQASQRIGGTGDAGESAFDRARKATVAAIERFTGYLERIALKLKHATANSEVTTNHSDQVTPAEDDMSM